MGSWLHSGSRFARSFQRRYFSKRNFRKLFRLSVGRADAERLEATAKWLFTRPRPYLVTDAAALCGFLDPLNGGSARTLVDEVRRCSALLSSNGAGAIVL